MIQLVSQKQVALDIISGRADADTIQRLFNKQLSLSEFELLECLVFLLFHTHYRSRAYGLLQSLPVHMKVQYAGMEKANPKAQFFLLMEALKHREKSIIKAQIDNQQFPDHLLTIIASEGDSPVLELLLARSDLLASHPQLLDLLKKNPAYRVGTSKAVEKPTTLSGKELLIKATSEAMIAEDGAGGPAAVSAVEVKKRAITLIQHIMGLSVSERLKLAYKGNRSERTILLNDSNKVVALAVLGSPKITSDEIMQIVNNRAVDQEIIARICSTREWTKTYAIVLGLLHNPKTPVSYAMGFIKQLHDRDLKKLLDDRNINPAIRYMARNFFKSKEKG